MERAQFIKIARRQSKEELSSYIAVRSKASNLTKEDEIRLNFAKIILEEKK